MLQRAHELVAVTSGSSGWQLLVIYINANLRLLLLLLLLSISIWFVLRRVRIVRSGKMDSRSSVVVLWERATNGLQSSVLTD